MKTHLVLVIVLISLIFCGCGNSIISSSSSDTKTMSSGNSDIVQSSGEGSGEEVDIDAKPYSDTQFFVIAHATISYDPTLIKKNDRPGDYVDIAIPYENYSYYEDGTLLEHQVSYHGSFYSERWERDENGNISMFDGRTGDDRITYVYDDNNRLIQEWNHSNYWPSSVTIYGDYDEYGNYGSTEKITSWGGSIFKQGDPWYDLDYIDYEEVRSTTYHYYTHEYDEMGRLISTTETRYDGSNKRTHTYEYDSKGNLIYEYNSGVEYIREYHSNGEIALLQVRWGDQLKEEIVYDTHGNPISKFSELDYTGTNTTYKNEYDKYGNLVRQYTYNEEGECKYYDIWQYIDKESYLKDIGTFLLSDENPIPSGSAQGFDPAKETSDDSYPLEAPIDNNNSSQSHILFSGPGWFEGVMGSKFYVPADFVQEIYEGTAKMPGMYTYSFQNVETNMKISVFETTFVALPMIDVSKEYETASSAKGVTYATSGKGYYVVSGYCDDDAIYYTRVDYNEDFYTSLEFTYPTENADACEKVLLEFLKDYSAN